jgi:hypothetical protein
LRHFVVDDRTAQKIFTHPLVLAQCHEQAK